MWRRERRARRVRQQKGNEADGSPRRRQRQRVIFYGGDDGLLMEKNPSVARGFANFNALVEKFCIVLVILNKSLILAILDKVLCNIKIVDRVTLFSIIKQRNWSIRAIHI